MDGATPGLMALCCINSKLSKPHRASQKAAFLHGFCFSSCPVFSSWWTIICKVPFLPKSWCYCFALDVCHSNRKPARTTCKRSDQAASEYCLDTDSVQPAEGAPVRKLECGNERKPVFQRRRLSSIGGQEFR